MSRTFEIYETICDICAILDGFSECSMYKGENSVTKDLGIPNFMHTYLDDIEEIIESAEE